MEDFHQDKEVRDSAIPIGSDEIPSISVSLEIPATVLDELLEKVNKKLVSKNISVTYTKEHRENTYELDSVSRKTLDIHNVYTETKKQIFTSIKAIEIKLKALESELNFPQFKKQKFSVYKAEAEAFKVANPTIIDIGENIKQIGEVADYYYEQEKIMKNSQQNL